MTKKHFVKIPSDIIRNETVKINSGDFLLYVRLSHLYFKNFQNEELKIDHKKLMLNIGVTDSRTLKKRLKSLYENGLIKNEISKLPRKGELCILFNSDKLNHAKHFTMMNLKIFNYIDKVSEHALRMVFYYKSHINLHANDKYRDYCFVGSETVKHNLKMGSDTFFSANKELIDNKLIKVVKHKLKTEYAYDENDELIFDKYNNHYYVNQELF